MLTSSLIKVIPNHISLRKLLPLNSYNGIIKTSDKLTMLTLIAQMNGFTLCTGMIYEKLNDKEYIAIPFQQNETHTEPAITIGYIVKKNRITSEICRLYLENIKKYLQ